MHTEKITGEKIYHGKNTNDAHNTLAFQLCKFIRIHVHFTGLPWSTVAQHYPCTRMSQAFLLYPLLPPAGLESLKHNYTKIIKG